MLYYFAPLEGITNASYRKAFAQFFSPLDKFYTPFFVPSEKKGLANRDLRELSPENNGDIHLVPQVLTNKSHDFLFAAKQVKDLGYGELNLNLGCPSGTVVSKKRGSGFLSELEALEKFLDEIFAKTEIDISVKTRLGLKNPEEFHEILALYHRYPISELTIHPRVREDHYRGTTNLAAYRDALQHSTIPLVYSGDLFRAEDILTFEKLFPKTRAIMLGRGLICNPALVEEVTLGKAITKEKLLTFHNHLYAMYTETLFGTKPLLFKMKELWVYMICLFKDHEKLFKGIKKAQTIPDYESAVSAIFSRLELQEQGGFLPPHVTSADFIAKTLDKESEVSYTIG